jgi:hypothetical protein
VAIKEDYGVALEVPLGLPFVASLDASFIFFFSSAASERARDHDLHQLQHTRPTQHRSKGGWPTFPAFSVASNDLEVVLAASIVDRATSVMPNRLRDIRGVVGVNSSGVALAGNSGGATEASSGDISAGGGENPDDGNDWRRFWVGGEILGVEFVAENV